MLALTGLLAILAGSSLGNAVDKDLLHAECYVKWTLSESCATAQQKIINQMDLWDNEDCGTQPGDTTPNGQKCLYHHMDGSGLVLDPEFSEDTNDRICTQRSTADC